MMRLDNAGNSCSDDGIDDDGDSSETERLIVHAVASNKTNEDNDDASSSDEDDDDDTATSSSTTSFWSELMNASWREHSIAIVVAVVATFIAYYIQHSNFFQQHQQHDVTLAEDPALGRSRHLLAPSLHHSSASLDHIPHRSANLTFCGDHAKINLPKGLSWMDFRIPSHLQSAMERLLPGVVLPSCWPTERGFVPYYPSPSIDSMYPHVVAQKLKQQQQQVAGGGGPSVSKTTKLIQPAHLTFTGFAAQFVNLSPTPVLLFWDGHGKMERRLVGELAPMARLTTATFTGESFSVSPVHDASTALARWVVTAEDAVQYYEPQFDDERMQRLLFEDPDLVQHYEHALLHKAFALDYLIHAKRTWLSHFPRPVVTVPIRPASYMGQQHTVKYVDGSLKRVWNMTVVSVSPRVFTIDNFLTPHECELLLRESDSPSSISTGGQVVVSSSNNNLTASIYDRTARLLQLPNLQHRVEHLHISQTSSHDTPAAPNHDWILPTDALHPHQPTRLASLQIQLQDANSVQGGETFFPRAITHDRHDGVTIPHAAAPGRAILWYNVLPDGNMDDRAQYGMHPVEKNGVVSTAHVWVWDPYVV